MWTSDSIKNEKSKLLPPRTPLQTLTKAQEAHDYQLWEEPGFIPDIENPHDRKLELSEIWNLFFT